MMNTKELKQLNNFMVVVGELKHKNLETKIAQTTGKEYIKGSIILEVRDGEDVSDVEFTIFSMDGNKNYDSIKTIKNDFVSKQEAMSPEFVTQVRAIGTVEINDFYNRDGELITHNEYKLIKAFTSSDAHKSELDIDVVIRDMKQDEEGKLKIDGFTVGYMEEIIELKTEIDVPTEFTESLLSFYKVGDIAPLKLKVGVAIKEDKDVKSFGIVDNKSYRKTWKLLGGMESKGKFTEDEMKRASVRRLSVLDELKAEYDAKNQGFGGGQTKSPFGQDTPSQGGFGMMPDSDGNIPF